MQCANCGAELRQTARFCNHCGTPVPSAADANMGNGVRRDGSTSNSPTPIARNPSAAPSGYGLAAPSTQPIMDRETDSRASSRPTTANVTHHLDPDDTTWVMPSATPQSAQAAQEPSGIASRSDGGSLNESVYIVDEAMSRPDDQLPWPLPGGIIIDGRYRVESLVSASEHENTYYITDLRGYEQCWACGRKYGASAASERYCRECGADMLAREFVLREHWVDDSEADSSGGQSATATTPAHSDDHESAARSFHQGGRAYRVEPKASKVATFPQGARLIAAAATNVGRTRSGEHNEDSALVLVLDRFHENRAIPFGFFVVADGLGGHASGQRASGQVINVLAHTILRQVALPVVGTPTDSPLDESQLANILSDAVRAANGSLLASNKEAGLDAGSTVVAALIYGETAYIANAGDSRAYVCDDEGLRRITSDHSLVEQLVAGGLIQRHEVYTHPQRNQIFRSLGDDPDMVVDVFVQQLQPGMRLLLCSDGLWEMVRDPQIEEVLRANGDPQSACDALIAAANEGGGEDNITVLVVASR